MAAQVMGKAHTLYITPEETAKGEMMCCNCTPTKPAQPRRIIPTRHRDQAPRPASQETAPISKLLLDCNLFTLRKKSKPFQNKIKT